MSLWTLPEIDKQNIILNNFHKMGEYMRIRRGRLVFYINQKKIYFVMHENTVLETRYLLKYTDPFITTSMNDMRNNIISGKIRNMEELAYYCKPNIKWEYTQAKWM